MHSVHIQIPMLQVSYPPCASPMDNVSFFAANPYVNTLHFLISIFINAYLAIAAQACLALKGTGKISPLIRMCITFQVLLELLL